MLKSIIMQDSNDEFRCVAVYLKIKPLVYILGQVLTVLPLGMDPDLLS